MMKTPLDFFDNNASGLLRNKLDSGAADTETLLAHNLADIVGTAAMFLTLIVLMVVFDWRMGLACMLAGIVSVGALFSMMGGKNPQLMAEYQADSIAISDPIPPITMPAFALVRARASLTPSPILRKRSTGG